jgi:hypothetical protein
MAAIAQSAVESLYTSISAASNVTTAQVAQSQSLLFCLLQVLFGPGTTSTVIKNGSV